MRNQGEISRRDGVLAYISQVLRMRKICRSSVQDWRGKTVRAVDTKVVGQIFALFDSPQDAIACALECVHDCHGENFELACGIGYTPVLNLDACNVFGDAVNMAFKLAEDVADGDEILVTENVINNVRRSNQGSALFISPQAEKSSSPNSPAGAGDSGFADELDGVSISLDDSRTVTLSGVTIPHWNLSISNSRDAKKLTELNHSSPVSATYANFKRKDVEDKPTDLFNKIKSRCLVEFNDAWRMAARPEKHDRSWPRRIGSDGTE